MRRFILVLLPILFFLPHHVGAADLTRLIQFCGRGQCENALGGEIRRLERLQPRPEVRDEEIGLIALALYTVARERNSRVIRRRVAGAFLRLANVSSNPEQAQLFRSVSAAIRTGDLDLFDLNTPISVSPS